MTDTVAEKLKYENDLLRHYESQLVEKKRLYALNGLSAHHESIFQLRITIEYVKERIKELEAK